MSTNALFIPYTPHNLFNRSIVCDDSGPQMCLLFVYTKQNRKSKDHWGCTKYNQKVSFSGPFASMTE